jgi:hypothetical protein
MTNGYGRITVLKTPDHCELLISLLTAELALLQATDIEVYVIDAEDIEPETGEAPPIPGTEEMELNFVSPFSRDTVNELLELVFSTHSPVDTVLG